MVKKEPLVDRISIGLTQREVDAYQAALRVTFRCGEQTEEYIKTLSARVVNTLARHAIWAVCKAIVRQGEFRWPPLACDLRHETPEETAERLGRPLPAKGPTVKDVIEQSPFDLEWLRRNFPDRWN